MLRGPRLDKVDLFDIDTKIPGFLIVGEWKEGSWDQKHGQIMSMHRSLLADRFKLKVRHETKQLPVYALTSAKNGFQFAEDGYCQNGNPRLYSLHLAKSEGWSCAPMSCCAFRRRDNLTAGIYILVEEAFWFHPAVWRIRARLLEERERACDEAVLQSGNETPLYAESTLDVCTFYVGSPLAECRVLPDQI